MFEKALAEMPEMTQTDMEQVAAIVEGITREEWARGLLALLIGWLAERAVMNAFRKAVRRSEVIPPSVRSMLETVVHILLILIVIMAAAGVMGIPLTSFVAFFSVIGIAISLSVQGVLSNFVGGMNILLSRPFLVGDFIESDGFSGTVTDIGIMHTRLRAPAGPVSFIPNSTLVAARLINYSAAETRRVELSVSADYGSAPEQVRRAVLSAIGENPVFLKDPAPAVNLESYGDSGIVYTIWAWVRPADFLSAKYALSEALYPAFQSAGIGFPYPQVVVHHTNGG